MLLTLLILMVLSLLMLFTLDSEDNDENEEDDDMLESLSNSVWPNYCGTVGGMLVLSSFSLESCF